eukprot:7477305-Alexandrium_andersonii.AAC.1
MSAYNTHARQLMRRPEMRCRQATSRKQHPPPHPTPRNACQATGTQENKRGVTDQIAAASKATRTRPIGTKSWRS